MGFEKSTKQQKIKEYILLENMITGLLKQYEATKLLHDIFNGNAIYAKAKKCFGNNFLTCPYP
jgi:hypothetical protein